MCQECVGLRFGMPGMCLSLQQHLAMMLKWFSMAVTWLCALLTANTGGEESSMHRLPSVVWTLAVTLFAATISHPAGIQKLVPVANQASQNHFGSKAFSETGLPCVPEVCLGDGMRRLSAVRWNKAKGGSLFDPTVSYATDLNVSEAQVKAIGRVFKGNTSAAVPYLIARTFDGDALAPLSAVTVACAADKLYGQFTATDGDPTTVGI